MSAFQYAVKVISYYFHVSFLETCKGSGLCPTALSIRKKTYIEFESNEWKVFWKETKCSKYGERSFGSVARWYLSKNI